MYMRAPGLQRTARAKKLGRQPLLAFLGPSFVVAVAYVDPGNLATNVTAGTTYGFSLLWVIVVANLIAMLVQYLSAKLGIATGRNLAEQCRESLPRRVTLLLWLQAEVVVIMTDLAEVVGVPSRCSSCWASPSSPAPS